jgi:methylmalonyl-CoA mutase
MMTQRDVHVNMLRTTIATLAAGLGGADAITVLPHTLALGLPDAFARRVARNTQLILLEESNLYRVADPAAGSGGIEDLTDKLCHAAWSLFQEIEKTGGLAEAVETGAFQDKVAATRAARQKAVAQRKDALTGTSDFPNLMELSATVLDVPPVRVLPLPATKTFTAMAPIRLAEPFEALRDMSDRTLQKSGARPKVFLANLGTPADFTARATFAKSFFEAGGIGAVGNDGFPSLDALAKAFAAAKAELVCLCSSDEVYARDALAAAKTLKDAGARHIFLAGRPKDAEALTAAGISSFIFAGCDALATLRAAYDMIGKV